MNENYVQILEDKHKLSILNDLYVQLINAALFPQSESTTYITSGQIRNKYSNNNRLAIKLDELEKAGLITQTIRKDLNNSKCIELTKLGYKIAENIAWINANLINTDRNENYGPIESLLPFRIEGSPISSTLRNIITYSKYGYDPEFDRIHIEKNDFPELIKDEMDVINNAWDDYLKKTKKSRESIESKLTKYFFKDAFETKDPTSKEEASENSQS